MFDLFRLQWIEKRRSLFNVANLLVNIFSVYLLLHVLVLGFVADRILLNVFPGENVVVKFTELSLYFFMMDLMMRFLLQKNPTIVIQPYLLLPINRNKLIHYPLLISLFNVFNLIPYLLFLPFFFRQVLPAESIFFSIGWLISLFSIAYVNNYLGINLKRFFQNKPWLVIVIVVSIFTLFYADAETKLLVSELFGKLLFVIFSNPYLFLLPIGLLVMVYFGSYLSIKRIAYLEDQSTKISSKSTGTGMFEFLQKEGEIGQLVLLELKLIWRNKRPKYFVFLCLFFLVIFGFQFYTNPFAEQNDMFMLFVGIFMTNMFMLQYGQFLFSWESGHFDHLLTYPVDRINYLKAKYWLAFGAAIISFVLSSPFAFFDINILYANFSCLLFNLGVTYVILIYLSSYNKKRIDITKSAFMNYEGMGGIQYLTGLVLITGPVLLFLPFWLLDISIIGWFFIGGIGLMGILMKDYVIAVLAKQMLKRKYIMSHGFRKI